MSVLAAPDLDTRADLPAPDWVWRISWRGRSWTDNDLTGQHLAVLSILRTDDDWRALDIPGAFAEAKASVADGYMRLVNMLIALISVDRAPEGTDDAQAAKATTEAIAEVTRAAASEIVGAISFRQ